MPDPLSAEAKGNSVEIKRFIGECVDKMTLHPDEVKVTIQQKTPGILSPALSQRVVAGALSSPLGHQLGPLLLREYRPQRQGRHSCPSPVP